MLHHLCNKKKKEIQFAHVLWSNQIYLSKKKSQTIVYLVEWCQEKKI